MEQIRTESVRRLCRALALLQTEKECTDFLLDLCTIKELQDMAQRLDTALLLDEGKNYQIIAKDVGVSTATISRVSRCLRYGSGGYRAVLDKLKEEE